MLLREEYHVFSRRHDIATCAVAVRPGAEFALTEKTMETDTGAKRPQQIQIQQHTFMGMAWFGAWLFTIGYLHLNFWRSLLAIAVWPYYIGVHVSSMMH
jgi:hypothetical protein